MRFSRTLIPTTRETPADAEIISHQLMLRAGLIRQLASGLYSWLPLGWRALQKFERIVREEMDRAGGLELIMPGVQPAELWLESGRWDAFGPELLRMRDRHDREFCLGPTHEEVITDIARREIRSYRQLPLNLYQIQTKFRDEVRPRFGVMRAREFIMKDAYSFDIDVEGMEASYQAMFDAYQRIFSRTGLDFRTVEADSGSIGGARSREFHVLASSGEDVIAFSSGSDFAANLELIGCQAEHSRPAPGGAMQEIATPDQHTIADLAIFLQVSEQKCLKTLLVHGVDGRLVALCLRGDHQLNEIKANALECVAEPLRFASPEEVLAATGSAPGSIGPVGLADMNVLVYADHSATTMADFICGANREGFHLRDTNWGRDLPEPVAADLRNAVEGDPAPDGSGTISLARGIEVGHIFQLGTKYSETLNAVVLNDQGKARPLAMGCYGIGITRVIAAALEQNNDDNGIIWPTAIAPYHVALLPINMQKSERLRERIEALYRELLDAGVEVLFDDRLERAGVMFADADLIGLPHRLTLGDRGLDEGIVEYKSRRVGETHKWPLEEACERIVAAIAADLST